MGGWSIGWEDGAFDGVGVLVGCSVWNTMTL